MDLNWEAVQTLKNILDGAYDEDKRLSLLADIENQHGNGPGLETLSCLSKMVPLMKSMEGLRRLMLLYSRKLIQLLDEMKILKNVELAQRALQQLKHFWSLCSNQQAALAPPHQVCGRWEPVVLDVVTSLASVYVDLFLVVHKQAENQMLWSKRLYSWLAFDLNQRALKTAFLEVSCSGKSASALLIPVLSKIVSGTLPSDSRLDYLLHMLLVRKWSHLLGGTGIVETSRNMKAPKKFIRWLGANWPQSGEYVPQDKSLKGRRVSEFILDLDETAVESLTDVYSECLSGREATSETHDMEAEETDAATPLFVVDKKGNNQPDDFSVAPDDRSSGQECVGGAPKSPDVGSEAMDVLTSLFVVDKKGSNRAEELLQKKGDGRRVKRKRSIDDDDDVVIVPTNGSPKAADLDFYIIPDKRPDSGSSPEKKKRKLEANHRDIDVTTDISATMGGKKNVDIKANDAKAIEINDADDQGVEILSDGVGESASDSLNDEDNPLGLDVTDFEALAEEEEVEEPEPEAVSHRTRQRRVSAGRSVVSQSNSGSKDSTVPLINCDEDEEGEDGGKRVIDVDSEAVEGAESDVEEVVVLSDKDDGKECRAITKDVGGKKLVVSDPVASYFSPQVEDLTRNNVQVFDLTQDGQEEKEQVAAEEKHTFHLSTLSTTARKRKSSEDSVEILSKPKRTSVETHAVVKGQANTSPVHTRMKSNSMSSPHSSEMSSQSNINVIHNDSSDDEITFKIKDTIHSRKSMIEEEISKNLSDIRKSVLPANGSEGRMKITEKITPSRMSTRLRTRGDSESSAGNADASQTPDRLKSDAKARGLLKSSISTLKDWLRSPPKPSAMQALSPKSSPKKAAKEADVRLGDSSSHLKSPPSRPKEKRKAESSVEERAGGEPSPHVSPDKKRRSLRKSDVFPSTYSGSGRKNALKGKSSPVSEGALLPSSDKHVSPEAKLYNLRTPKKSGASDLKSPRSLKASRIDSYFPSQDKLKSATNPEDKAMNADKRKTPIPADNLTPNTPTRRKAALTPSNPSPIKSTPSRRRSMRSSSKAD